MAFTTRSIAITPAMSRLFDFDAGVKLEIGVGKTSDLREDFKWDKPHGLHFITSITMDGRVQSRKALGVAYADVYYYRLAGGLVIRSEFPLSRKPKVQIDKDTWLTQVNWAVGDQPVLLQCTTVDNVEAVVTNLCSAFGFGEFGLMDSIEYLTNTAEQQRDPISFMDYSDRDGQSYTVITRNGRAFRLHAALYSGMELLVPKLDPDAIVKNIVTQWDKHKKHALRSSVPVAVNIEKGLFLSRENYPILGKDKFFFTIRKINVDGIFSGAMVAEVPDIPQDFTKIAEA